MNLEKLFFQVDMLDGVTGPVGKMQKKLDGFATYARKSFTQVGVGAAGMWAAAEGITSMLGPAREMNKALQEVSSLDVSNSALKQLNSQALKYSIKYGESADAFASSAYDIQSSIAGLDGNELAAFTNSSNVLAKATKADAATITDYTGTMFGIFKNEANAMGKAKWVEQLTGQTATAVQMFKTNGMEMSSAFTSLGASATSAGINAAEQMAVLGSLQSTMSGSEAGTKYKSFLSGVGGAQDKLGLKFTDSNGKMLGMMDILTKLKGKFGDSLDVAESDTLKNAFGSDEAVGMLKLLMADTDGLGKSINKLGDVTGMSKAEQMAAKMVDPFDRLSAGGRALTTVIGQALLPVINPLVDGFANGAAKMTEWAEEYPNITRWVGYAATGILGFTGILGAAAAASGVMRIATFGLGVVFGPLNRAVQWSKSVWTAYSGSQWLANAALWGFPATWIIGALVGVGVAVGAVIYWWDDLTAAFTDMEWWDSLVSLFDFEKLFAPIGQLVTFFEDAFTSVFGSSKEWWDSLGSIFDFVKMFTPIGLIYTLFTEGFDGVLTLAGGWWDTLGSIFDFAKMFSPIGLLYTFFTEGFDGVLTLAGGWWDSLDSLFNFQKLFAPIGQLYTFFTEGFDGVLTLAGGWWDSLGSLFDFAKMFSPIGLIYTFFTEGFEGVLTLAGGWWDSLSSIFNFHQLFAPIGQLFTFFDDAFTNVFGSIEEWWDSLSSIFDFQKLFAPIGQLFTFFNEGFDGVFTSILGWFDTLGSGADWFLDKINMLPGVDLKTSSETNITSTTPSLEAPRTLRTPPGGASQKISNSMTKNQSSSQSIGKVVIQTEGKQDAQSLREQLLLAGA